MDAFLKCLRREISDLSQSDIGTRITDGKYCGTICFIGKIFNCDTIWLGVDWDDASRGRHNGMYEGVQYFCTKSINSGSFVKPSKVFFGITFEEALVREFVLCDDCQPSLRICNYGEIESSMPPKFVENNMNEKHVLCGPAGVKHKIYEWKTINVSSLPIFRALYGPNALSLKPVEFSDMWPLPGGCLGQILTNIEELDISSCLFSKWIDVSELCIQLPHLKKLVLNKNRLRLPLPSDMEYTVSNEKQDPRLSFDLDSDPVTSEQLNSKAFLNIHQLVFTRGFLDWSSLKRIISWMPSLKILSVAYNDLGNPTPDWSDQMIRSIGNLTYLDLICTNLTSLDQLFFYIGPSKSLDSLFLNSNQFTNLPVLNKTTDTDENILNNGPSDLFPNLSNLSLIDSSLNNLNCINELLKWPKLEHLNLAQSVLYQLHNPKTIRQEIIARLPKLKSIDKVEITSDERRGAELDYIKRYGSEWLSLSKDSEEGSKDNHSHYKEFLNLHPTFSLLCEKHGPPEIGETKKIVHSLKEGLISINLTLQYQSGDSCDGQIPQQSITKHIPSRMSVSHLKMLIRRLFKLSARSKFNLYAQSQKYANTRIESAIDNDTREIGFYDLENDDTIFVRVCS